jgi:hypothetical protein
MAINDALGSFDLEIPSGIDLRLSGKIKISGKTRISSRTDSRLAQILRKLESKDSSLEFGLILDQVLKEAISSNIWSTRNGTDDIIDSGALKESGNIKITAQGLEIEYDVPYAALIHYGGYIIPYGNTNAGKVYIPPRPWVATVLSSGFSDFNPALVYRDIILRILKSL